MAGVREHGAVAHQLEVLAAQHPGDAGDGDEDLAERRRGERAHHLEALHPRLERATGSTSQTITAAPAPLARWATPRPAEP